MVELFPVIRVRSNGLTCCVTSIPAAYLVSRLEDGDSEKDREAAAYFQEKHPLLEGIVAMICKGDPECTEMIPEGSPDFYGRFKDVFGVLSLDGTQTYRLLRGGERLRGTPAGCEALIVTFVGPKAIEGCNLDSSSES